MIILELTDDEALTLRNLLDAAVRAQGMRAAEFAIVIDQKILKAAQEAQARRDNAGANGKPRQNTLLGDEAKP